MPVDLDFERAWQQKLSRSLERVAGADVCAQVMEGGDGLSAESNTFEVEEWSRKVLERLGQLVGEAKGREIMTDCGCQYPLSELSEIRRRYQESGDIDLVIRMLQDKFETFLRDTMGLEEELIETIVSRGWGLAGVRQGDIIVATKIPKSGYLLEYFQESDLERKRQLYCHCPRVRDILGASGSLPQLYCYCGAGFYKGIWEEILQMPVEVEVLETVLDGGEVCKIAVHLPDGA